MLPHERSLVEELKDKPFAIVGVNSDSKEKLQELVKDGTTTWRNFTNQQKGGRKISDEWGVRGWPTLYIIDAKGVIRHKGLRGEQMEKAIKALIAETEAGDKPADAAPKEAVDAKPAEKKVEPAKAAEAK